MIVGVICRPQERRPQATASHIGKVTLERLVLSHLSRVKIFQRIAECGFLQKSTVEGHRPVFAKLKERMVRFSTQLHVVALGLLKKQPGKCENRVSDQPRLNLPDDAIEGSGIGEESNANRKRLNRRPNRSIPPRF